MNWKLSRSQARRYAKDAAAMGGKKWATAWQKLLKTRPEDRNRIFEAMERVHLQPIARHRAPAHGATRITLKQRMDGKQEGEFLLNVPPRYSSKKPMPLLFRLHGSGQSAETLKFCWGGEGYTRKFLAVTPTLPLKLSGMSIMNAEIIGFLDKIYAYMLQRFAVDTDRVYLSGYFMGSGYSFVMAQLWPHRFAAFHSSGIVFCAHTDWEGCMDAAREVPGYFIIGLTDAKRRIRSHRKTAAYYAQQPGYRGVFREVAGRGMDQPFFEDLNDEAYKFLLKQKRRRYPKSFHAMLYEPAKGARLHELTNTIHWLRAQEFSRGQRCQVTVEGNEISVAAKGLKKAEVFLNDHIIDLDRDVKIRLNGREVFSGRVERSVEFLRMWLDRHRDPGWLFWNKVSITGPE